MAALSTSPKKPPKPAPPLPVGMSQCVTFNLRAQEKTDWVDVGKVIDTMNHASWNLPAGNYTLTLGLKDCATVRPSLLALIFLHFQANDSGMC